jgi:hypothetical protein
MGVGLLTSDEWDKSGEFMVIFTALVKLLRIPEMYPAYVDTNTSRQPLVQGTRKYHTCITRAHAAHVYQQNHSNQLSLPIEL